MQCSEDTHTLEKQRGEILFTYNSQC